MLALVCLLSIAVIELVHNGDVTVKRFDFL